MLVEFILVGGAFVVVVALFLWLHWPERTGVLGNEARYTAENERTSDASVADVGTTERPRGWRTRPRGMMGSREPGASSGDGPVAPE